MSYEDNRIKLVRGDITQCNVDAIVNAANESLLGGGGVDGAIHHTAGPELLIECRALGGCPTGQAKITKGYQLPAKYIIHTVGPVYRGGNHGEPERLASCYRETLKVAQQHECTNIAFPAISCGVYGYPIQEASIIAIKTVREFQKDSALPDQVLFVLFGQSDYDTYEQHLSSGQI